MENLSKTEEMKCELHCHTEWSWDCETPVKKVIEYCLDKGVNVLAITDHNEIEGAFEAQKLAPPELKIIIGEEIGTNDGHVIGLFLTKKVEPHQSAAATMAEIKRQGGLVLVPHAFDRLRGGLGKKNLLALKDSIDFLEIFNARVLIAQDNIRALNFAKEQGLASYVGSDSHTVTEYGNALSIIGSFATKDQFAAALRQAQFTTQLSGFNVYVLTEFVKWKKKINALMRR